jgi:hypothetical protein
MTQTVRARIVGIALAAGAVSIGVVNVAGNRQVADDADRVRARARTAAVTSWALPAVADAVGVPGTDVVLLDRCAVVTVKRLLAERQVHLALSDGNTMRVVKSCKA